MKTPTTPQDAKQTPKPKRDCSAPPCSASWSYDLKGSGVFLLIIAGIYEGYGNHNISAEVKMFYIAMVAFTCGNIKREF